MENEESDDNLSSEDENDDDDDADWAQSDNFLQWDATNEASRTAAHQRPSPQYDFSSAEFEPLISPLPSDEMLPFSSLDQYFPDQSTFGLGGAQGLEQAINPSSTGVQVIQSL